MFEVGEWDVDLLDLSRVTLRKSVYVEIDEADDAPVDIAMNALLLRNGTSTVLIDTGPGVTAGALGLPETDLPGALAALGVAPEDVDLICLTHLDYDHFGGALAGTWPDDLRPVFPGATVVAPAVEVDWARAGGSGIVDFEGGPAAVAALGSALRGVESGEVAPGVRLRDAPGHTPGHTVIEIDGDPPLLYFSDVIHAEFLVEEPQPVNLDRDPQAALDTRLALLQECERRGLDVLATHVPSAAPGRIERANGAFRWTAAGR